MALKGKEQHEMPYHRQKSIPVVRNVPAEAVLFDDIGETRLVGEEEGQVRRQDAVLHVP
jgi:hypothetical protein